MDRLRQSEALGSPSVCQHNFYAILCYNATATIGEHFERRFGPVECVKLISNR